MNCAATKRRNLLRIHEPPKRVAPWTLRLAGAAMFAGAMLTGMAAGQTAAPSEHAPAQAMSAAPPAAGQGQIPSKSLLGILRAGGVLMIPLVFCSFILVVFMFERTISLRRGRVIPGPFVKRFLHQLRQQQLDRGQSLVLCEENKSPMADVFAAAVRKWGRPAVEVEQAVLDAGERVANGLRRYLRLFNGVATVSPLLGLLGTVFGMIRAFNEIASSDAMGRAELLAAGISEALLTTAAGLTIAIPALTGYLFFISRVDRLVMDIDALGLEVVQLISAEGLEERPSIRPHRGIRREAA